MKPYPLFCTFTFRCRCSCCNRGVGWSETKIFQGHTSNRRGGRRNDGMLHNWKVKNPLNIPPPTCTSSGSFSTVEPLCFGPWNPLFFEFMLNLLSYNSLTLNCEALREAWGDTEISCQIQLPSDPHPGVSLSLISPAAHSISSSKQQQLGRQGFDPATRRQARDELASPPRFLSLGCGEKIAVQLKDEIWKDRTESQRTVIKCCCNLMFIHVLEEWSVDLREGCDFVF